MIVVSDATPIISFLKINRLDILGKLFGEVLLPEAVEAKKRVLAMVAQMDKEDCATCTNLYKCQAACPKGITVDYIAKKNCENLGATVTYAEKVYGND